MKITSVFKKSSVFVTAMLLVLLMVFSIVPLAQAADSDEDVTYRITAGDVELGDKLTAMNISQSGNITMMFYYTSLDGIDDNDYLQVTVPRQSGSFDVTRYKKSELTKVGERYLVEVPVAAAQQTDLVKLQWFQVDENGTAKGAKIREYSVKYYAGVILGSTTSQMIPAVKSMLNYGAMAQTMFGYKTNNLANKDLYTKENNPVNGMISEHFYDAEEKEVVTGGTVAFKGANVFLQDRITMRIYFEYAEGFNTENTTVAISRNGEFVGEGYNVHLDKDTGYYFVNIHNVSAHNFDVQYTVEVKDDAAKASSASFTYSVLGYALDTLNSYLSSEEQKDTAKALYLYYAWMKNYATTKDNDEGNDYTPGATSCAHERSHVEGEKMVCSDCGATVTLPKISLIREDSNELSVGKTTTVTFKIMLVGDYDLEALNVTPKLGDSNLGFTIIDRNPLLSISDGLNILVEPASGDSFNDELITDGYIATIECEIEPDAAGNMKAYLAVREAITASGENINNDIISSPAWIKASPEECAEHAYEYVVSTDTHTQHCAVCERVFVTEAHNTAEVLWTHVEGTDIDGKLYEHKKCSVCGGVAETRECFYHNNHDSYKVNGVVINPQKAGNTGQTDGLSREANSYSVFDASKNFVDGDGNKVVVSTNLSFSGWFGVNGGVSKYVYKINDGDWMTAIGTPGTPAATSPVGKAILEKKGINAEVKVSADGKTSYPDLTKAQYGLTVSGLQAYAGETITITFAVVPAGNPGTAENPNTLIIGILENLEIACAHAGQNCTYTPTGEPFAYNVTCNKCGADLGKVEGINADGNTVLLPGNIVSTASGAGGESPYLSIENLTDPNFHDIPFTRVLAIGSTTKDESFVYINPDKDAKVGKYVAVIYRTNSSTANEMYISASDSVSAGQSVWAGSGFHTTSDGFALYVFDFTSYYTWSEETGIGVIRWDINEKVSEGDYLDIACVSFFDSKESAQEFYNEFSDMYELNYITAGNIQSLIVNGELAKGNIGVVGRTFYLDFSGITLNTAASITYDGWYSAPKGINSYSLRIYDGENTTIEGWISNPNYRADIKNHMLSLSFASSAGYTDACGNGSGIYETSIVFGPQYQGKTIDFDILANTADGRTLVVACFTNVTVPVCNHENSAVVEAKAPTCIAKGHEAYTNCALCHAILNSDGEVIDEIPELDIVPDAHKVVEMAYTYPTGEHDGWYAHKTCEYCSKTWDLNDAELDAAPSISKLNPTVNKYWGYDQIKNWKTSGDADKKTVTTPSTDRSYVRFERIAACGDVYIEFMASNKAATGKYLVMKYRTDHVAYVQLWANTTANGHSGGKANFDCHDFKADGKWHIAIIDLAKSLPTYVKEENGTYTIQWARMDIFDSTADSGYFDIGFMALCDDLEDTTSAFLAGDTDYCSHIGSETGWTFDKADLAFEHNTCLVCGGVAKRASSVTLEGKHVFSHKFIKDKLNYWASGKATLVEEENGFSYTRLTLSKTVTSEQTVFLHADASNPVTNIGKYVAVLYRTSITGNRIEVVADSTLTSVKAGVCNFGEDNTRTDKWTFKVKQYGGYGSADNASAGYYNGTSFTAFRLDFFNPGTFAAGGTTDIAFIAFFDSVEEANAYYAAYVKAYDVPDCQHVNSTVFDSSRMLYVTTCAGCGNETTKDMLYKAEGFFGSSVTVNGETYYNAESSGNFISATQQEGGIVRYTPKKSASDPYFYPFKGNTTNVTGTHMVIKYRLVNNNKNIDIAATFASTAASGQTQAAGKNGDSSNAWLSNTMIADGKWHYLVVSPNLNTNTTFKANTDGTYTWAYLRMRLGNGFAANDGSCYLEIDEMAFADEQAALHYAGVDYPLYVAHFDSLKLDSTSMSSIPGNTSNTCMVKDMSGETLTTAKSISAGGWFVTPGGVKAYKIRVTKIDGVAVADPTLVGGVSGGTVSTTDGVTKVGTALGWYTDCRLNARYTASSIDLSDYKGKTIEFEIVAITNYGEVAILARFTNVAVPAVYNAYLAGNHFVDDTNVKGNATITSGIVYANKIVFDLSNVAVYNDSTFKMNGWITANSGIASYKYRVIEGENVYEVAATGTISTDPGVTTDGMNNGFDADCANNGSFTDLKFSLADVKDANGVAVDLVGKAITVQMIAVANNGTEFVVATFNNVAVKPEIMMFVNSSYAGKQLTQQAGHSEHFIFDESHPDYLTLFTSGNIPTSDKAEYLGCVYVNGWGGITIRGKDVTISGIAFRVKDKEGNVIGNGWYTQLVSGFFFTNKSETAVVNGLATKLPGATAYTFKGYADLDIVEGLNANDLVDVEFAFIYDDANGNTQYLSFLTLTNVLKST